MAKQKRKRKPKKKRSEVTLFWQQVEGCLQLSLKLLAGFLTAISLLLVAFLVYLQMLYPAFDSSVWILISGLFAYLSGYFAFVDDEDDDTEENDNP